MEKTRKQEVIERILALSNRQFELLIKVLEQLKQNEDIALLDLIYKIMLKSNMKET